MLARRAVRLALLGYLVKSVLLAGVWWVAPELPRSALARAREAWARVAEPTR